MPRLRSTLIRNVPAFSRFLHALACSHGELINFANLARDFCARLWRGELA